MLPFLSVMGTFRFCSKVRLSVVHGDGDSRCRSQAEIGAKTAAKRLPLVSLKRVSYVE
jgi:hypothetical protein